MACYVLRRGGLWAYATAIAAPGRGPYRGTAVTLPVPPRHPRPPRPDPPSDRGILWGLTVSEVMERRWLRT